MPRFPRSEADIAALALVMVQGFGQAAEDFPAAPVPGSELQARLDAYHSANAATITAEAAFREQHTAKDKTLGHLVGGMKADLRYAEAAARDNPEKLKQLGWGARRDGSSLGTPGEVRDIKILTEGDTWLILQWNPPVDGGAPSAYKIQRKREGASWEDVGTSVDTRQLVNNQPRGVEFNYRVLAMNKAGTGQPSATVTLVL